MDYAKLIEDHGKPTTIDFDGTTLSYHWPDTAHRLEVTKVSDGLFRVLWDGKLVSKGSFPTPWLSYEISARLFWDRTKKEETFDRDLMIAFVGDYRVCWEAFRVCAVQYADELMPGVW